jgi:hypothetical protein
MTSSDFAILEQLEWYWPRRSDRAGNACLRGGGSARHVAAQNWCIVNRDELVAAFAAAGPSANPQPNWLCRVSGRPDSMGLL